MRKVPPPGIMMLAGAGLWLAGCQRHATPTQPEPAPAAVADDPRVTYATPYKNVRPEVKYVGDSACADCHPTQTEGFHKHPMGRSLFRMTAAPGVERYDRGAHNPFESGGYQFLIERRGDRVLHSERRRDAQGQVLTELSIEVDFALGSGTRGRSYLINHEGYLYQSFLSWYAQKKSWDLSPGFSTDRHAERPIVPACLFCHSNQVEPVPHTVNRYRQPIFGQGYAIGCERCHGPGELHAQLRERGEPVDDLDSTIVNPRRLAPELRESICQQCHIHDEARVLRRGRAPFDFRPGLPIHLFWTIYVRRPELTDHRAAVSHEQQMYASRCFQKSQGKMGCISCHDPHFLPAAERKAEYYRKRCLTCHQEAGSGGRSQGEDTSGSKETGCTLSVQVRTKRQANDSCIACHMPPFDIAKFAHTALTDHRILRQVDRARPAAVGGLAVTGKSPIIPFLRESSQLPEAEIKRDLGIALLELRHFHPQVQTQLAAMAEPLLKTALEAWPDDLPALHARATALMIQNLDAEAFQALEALLERAPEHELALVDEATLATRRGERSLATERWRRALAVNPWSSRYHHELGTVLGQDGRLDEALEESQAALRLNPSSIEARLLRVTCHIAGGRKDRARVEFDQLMTLNPPQAEALRRWFVEHTR
jgi:Flp pilus assembly protein TadD